MSRQACKRLAIGRCDEAAFGFAAAGLTWTRGFPPTVGGAPAAGAVPGAGAVLWAMAAPEYRTMTSASIVLIIHLTSRSFSAVDLRQSQLRVEPVGASKAQLRGQKSARAPMPETPRLAAV